MAEVIVEIVLLDKSDDALKAFSDTYGAEVQAMTADQIADAICVLHPEQADAVQLALYERLWGEDGIMIRYQNRRPPWAFSGLHS